MKILVFILEALILIFIYPIFSMAFMLMVLKGFFTGKEIEFSYYGKHLFTLNKKKTGFYL